MEDDFRRALVAHSRDEAYQSFVLLVLTALKHGPPLPGLGALMLDLARDASWEGTIRYKAVEVCAEMLDADRSFAFSLCRLLDDVHVGRVPDPCDDVLGTLLDALYPEHLAVSEAIQHLRKPKRPTRGWKYARFWNRRFLERSTLDQLVEFLALLGVPDRAGPSWLSDSPKAPGFPGWLLVAALRRVLEAAPERLTIGEAAFLISQGDGRDGSLGQEAATRLRGRPTLAHVFAATLAERERAHEERPSPTPSRAGVPEEKEDGRFPEIRKSVKENEPDLLQNRAAFGVLHVLAVAYLDGFADVIGETPTERLEQLLGKRGDLVASALAGLRGVIDRPDLPKYEEVIGLAAKGRMHHCSYPVLVSLEERWQSPKPEDVALDDEQMGLALAIQFAVPGIPQGHPTEALLEWFRGLVASRPATVAAVWTRCARPLVRAGATTLPYSDEFAHSPDHAAVAGAASLDVLRRFPSVARGGNFPS